MIDEAPAAEGGQELNQDRQKSQFSKKHPKFPNGKNRIAILEQIAERWSARGFYRSPSRAMAALLEGVE